MKKIIMGFQTMLILPSIALAQQPYTPSLLDRGRNFFEMNVGWSLLSLVLTSLFTLIALSFVRKKSEQTKRTWMVLLAYMAFGIWYFYPAFTYHGIYAATIDGHVEYIEITETYNMYSNLDHEMGKTNNVFTVKYDLKPFHRMLWLEFDNWKDAGLPHIPVKLGCNHLHQIVIKEGWVKFIKIQQANQQMDAAKITADDNDESSP